MKKLSQQIEELNSNLSTQLSPEVIDTFGKSIHDLKTKNMEENSIRVGEKFPDFILFNADNQIINLTDLLKKEKVVIAFFRGNWCPYCNLELKALQENSGKITGKKATLLAISPQKLDYSKELRSNHRLEFELLRDKDNALAKQIGISFQLQDYAIPVYRDLGINLFDFNSNNENELPVPAVFVVDTDQTIIYKFMDSNYMNRLDINELIENL
ncbi:MAG: AhpC/TSA family protein [Tannerella sp.]|jgi:peroxiredoxin|nr:AhpC/TSA family protein [Tannerella sp.]